MDSHEAGRSKAAWRERNAGADAPGDGQNQPTVKPYTDDEADPHEGSVDPYADTTKQTTKAEPAKGLSTKTASALLGRRKN